MERMELIGSCQNIEYAGTVSDIHSCTYCCPNAYCRDAFTTSGDFIISPHSAAEGLYVATCGNFHGWKFFPVLGKYVVQMLEGELEPELVSKWAWDREQCKPFIDYPRHEMANLADPHVAML